VTEGTKEGHRVLGRMSYRAAARLAWSLWALSVALLLGGAALSRVASSAVSDLSFVGETGDASVVANLITLLPFSVVGTIVASRKPRNAIGWLFCGVGVTLGLNSFAGDFAEFWLASGFGKSSLGETAAWFSSWLWFLLIFVPMSLLLLLFPDGRLPSPRWRPVAWGVALGTAGGVVGNALKAGPLVDFPQIANPYGVDSPVVGMVGVAGTIVAAGSMVGSAVSLIVRLRRVGSEQRQQIKWLAYGGAVMVGGVFAGALAIPWNVPLSITIMSVALPGLPVFTGIAIVRHHLYDIDILINRTLVYGSLTAMLALVYFGGVTATQAIFQTLTGQDELPQLVVVTSTLLIAALFNPLRRRIQSFIDRRFYRSKYDAIKTLEAFSVKLRDVTDPDALSDDLVGLVRETMQPAHVSLWLRPEKALKGAQTD
jgi:MFS family permease